MSYEQDIPNTIKLELTEGCNRFCTFCGIRGIRTKPNQDLRFLTVEIVTSLATQMRDLGWNSKIEIAMRGEPSLNPDMFDIVATIRHILPKQSIMFTSNGAKLHDTESICRLLDMGVNCLALDDYGQLSTIRDAWPSLKIYPDDKKYNPYQKWKCKDKVVVVMPDITETVGGVHSASILSNHCGTAAPRNDKKKGKRCARPFREMVVLHDGTVIGCCNDFRGELIIGNISEGLNKVWQSDIFMALRKLLFHGSRTKGPCKGCDSFSYRVGILPDKQGNLFLAPANERYIKILDEALARGPFSTPVLREWEL